MVYTDFDNAALLDKPNLDIPQKGLILSFKPFERGLGIEVALTSCAGHSGSALEAYAGKVIRGYLGIFNEYS